MNVNLYSQNPNPQLSVQEQTSKSKCNWGRNITLLTGAAAGAALTALAFYAYQNSPEEVAQETMNQGFFASFFGAEPEPDPTMYETVLIGLGNIWENLVYTKDVAIWSGGCITAIYTAKAAEVWGQVALKAMECCSRNKKPSENSAPQQAPAQNRSETHYHFHFDKNADQETIRGVLNYCDSVNSCRLKRRHPLLLAQ